MIDILFHPQTDSEHKACLKDKGWRMNNHYSMVDERGDRVKFRQRTIQRRSFLEAHGLDVYLKSRRHGITTEKCLEILDDALNHPDLACGIIAHTQPAAWAIFEKKIKMPYEALPAWVRKHNPAVEMSKSHIKFTNGSTIRVAVSFQSDTLHRLHVSELGPLCAKFPARAAVLFSDTFPAVHPEQGGRIGVESTADGGSGPFYDMCAQARADTKHVEVTNGNLGVMQWKFHFYSATDDPANVTDDVAVPSNRLSVYFGDLEERHAITLTDRQKSWYSLKCDGAGGLKRKMKQHYPMTPDEAFEQSVEGSVYSEELQDAYDEGRIGNFPWVKGMPVFTFWDLGVSTGNANVVLYAQFIRDEIRIIDYYECENRGMVYHAAQVLAKPYTWAPNEPFCFMPHDVADRDKLQAIPLIDSAELLGLRISKVEAPLNKDADGIEAVRAIFPRLRINVFTPNEIAGQYDGTARLIKAIGWYRYEYDEERLIWSKVPIHDWSSNACDGLQTMALAFKYGRIGGTYLGGDRFAGEFHRRGSVEDRGVQRHDLLTVN